MAIKFDKLFALLKERGMRPQSLRNDKIVGNATLEKLKGKQVTGGTGKHYYGSVDTRAINNICEYLECQPGEIMEWVPDEPSEAESTAEDNENEGRS